MNNKPNLTSAGIWHYASNPGADIVTFYDQISLGPDGLNGLILAGWSYAGWDNKTFRTTNIAILEQNKDGTLKINTTKYVSDPTINGAGSVIVYDFNEDGREDVFLAAHNESPLVSKASTALMANTDGTFRKIILSDTTQAHAATLGVLQKKPTIVTAGYGEVDAYFQFDSQNNQFTTQQWGNDATTPDGNSKSFYGSVAIATDFDNDGDSELIIGDDRSSPGVDFEANGPSYFAVYELNGNRLADTPTFKTTLYFDNNPVYKSLVPEGSGGLTHNYRLWADDFNHDGLTDVIAGVSIWANNAFQASKLELMQNLGALQFSDRTDQLASVYSEKSNNVDYSMQLIDIDHSGINSYLLAEAFSDSTEDNCNYLLLNDGTGKLYAALHDEFITWGREVGNYLDAHGIAYNKSFIAPKFIAYQTEPGSINYLAQWVGANDSIPLVNVPVHYNVATDFNQNITVSDRNQSSLIRTWAGNDRFFDTNSNSSTRIDGGIGIDMSIYSGKVDNYKLITKDNLSSEVQLTEKSSNLSVNDTLVNIERLQFADTNVALDYQAGGHAGQAYRLYKGVLGREGEPGGLGYVMNRLDQGETLKNVASGYLNSPEFLAKYGNADQPTFINLLYQNILGRAADASGTSFINNWMASGATREDVTLGFTESPEYIAQCITLIGNSGIHYNPVVA